MCVPVLLLLAGCIFSPKRGKGGGPPPPPVYEIPSTPEFVLKNLAAAYAARDSNEYKSLFDSNYTGTSIDQTQPVLTTLPFTKDSEAQHISALARNPDIRYVEMQLVPPGGMIRILDLSDPPGWVMIQNPVIKVQIFEPDTTREVKIDSGETIEFRFKPKTPDASSPTDTTWQIIRWTEIYTL